MVVVWNQLHKEGRKRFSTIGATQSIHQSELQRENNPNTVYWRANELNSKRNSFQHARVTTISGRPRFETAITEACECGFLLRGERASMREGWAVSHEENLEV
jgi:hypothetical protein